VTLQAMRDGMVQHQQVITLDDRILGCQLVGTIVSTGVLWSELHAKLITCSWLKIVFLANNITLLGTTDNDYFFEYEYK
jgi:hypothetical protein